MSIPRWVLFKRAAELTGYSEDAIRHKVKNGTWAQGRIWRKERDNRVFINIEDVGQVGRELSAGSGLEAELTKHIGVEIHGNSLRITFMWRRRRCRETLGLPVTKPNIRHAAQLRAAVLSLSVDRSNVPPARIIRLQASRITPSPLSTA